MVVLRSNSPPKPTQKECCYAAALEDDATFCEDCGKPLIRCMAAEQCRGLLDDHGLCTICVQPMVQVDAGAVSVARVGDAVALPLTIVNASAAGRPLLVTGLWVREGGIGEWHKVQLGWERVGPGEARHAKIVAREITQTGNHNVELRIAVSNHYQWRKECYVFKTDLVLTIAPKKPASGPVVNIGGESAGDHNVVYISSGSEPATQTEKTDAVVGLDLSRVEIVERDFALRGISPALYVPRNVRLIWSGFPPMETPHDGPVTTRDGLLKMGRSRSVRDGGLMDVRLLAETPAGEVDGALSVTMSRHHFELYVECDRLMLRVVSDKGLRVNGEGYSRDEKVMLEDGAIISPLAKHPDALSIRVRFHVEHKCVRQITLRRTPASKRES